MSEGGAHRRLLLCLHWILFDVGKKLEIILCVFRWENENGKGLKI